MKLNFNTPSRSKVIFGVCLLTAVAAAFAVTTYVNAINAEKSELQNSLQLAQKKIVDMTNELGTSKVDSDLFQKEKNQIITDLEQANNTIEAFAKQAKACDSLKKQLKIKN